MYGLEKLDKEYVLARLSEEQIMSYYLQVPVQFSKMIVSPLRVDKIPTCGFSHDQRGNLKFKDFSGHFHGDCFNVVEYIYHCDFLSALTIIARDFNLRGTTTSPQRIAERSIQLSAQPKAVKSMAVKRQQWTETDKVYWSAHGIKSNTLNVFHVQSLAIGWINDRIVYTYQASDPGYVYHYPNGKKKFYFPLRDNYRFLTNDANVLQGYEQLPKSGKLLIVTKSLKDVMYLYQLGVSAVAPAAESIILSANHYTELIERFNVIVSLYDYDLAGIRGANKMKKLYKIPPYFLTNGRFNTSDFQGKDITDYHKLHGEQKTRDLVTHYTSPYL